MMSPAGNRASWQAEEGLIYLGIRLGNQGSQTTTQLPQTWGGGYLESICPEMDRQMLLASANFFLS